MRKKLFVVGSAVLMCFNQFIYVSNATASPAVGDYFVDMELAGKQKFSSADLDKLYPIDADNPKWKKLVTEEDKFANTQIASSVAEKMDTGTLLEAVMRSPMLYTVENADDRESGTMEFLEKTNAGQELLERKGAKDAIVKEYLSLEIPEETLNDYSEIDNCSSEEYNSTIMRLLADEEFSKNVDEDIAPYHRIHFLEGAILSDEIYPKLSVEEKKKLYDKSLVLNKQKKNSRVFAYCAEDSFTLSLMEDVELAKNIFFPKGRKGAKVKITYFNIQTPNGSDVPAEKHSDNHVNSSEYVSSYQKERPKITVVAPGWSKSNCHAYTWPGRSDILLKHPGKFLTDGSYVKEPAGRPTANYQKVTNGSHSAIVINCGSQRIKTKMYGSPIYECDLKVDFPSGYEVYKRNNVC